MDKKQVRINRLKAYAKSRGVEEDHAALGELIGKKPNQVYNLLSGQSSFGEKVARSIEAKAGLPSLWLDAEEGLLADLPPAVAAAAAAMALLPEPQQEWVLELFAPVLATAKRIAEAGKHEPGQESSDSTKRSAATK